MGWAGKWSVTPSTPVNWSSCFGEIQVYINWVTWFFQLSWQCKLATIKSFWGEFLSFSSLSEQWSYIINSVVKTKLLSHTPPRMQHFSFFRNLSPLYINWFFGWMTSEIWVFWYLLGMHLWFAFNNFWLSNDIYFQVTLHSKHLPPK